MAKDAKKVAVAITFPAGKHSLRVRAVVTPGQSLGVTAVDSRGLIHSATTFTNCIGSPAQPMCTYKIPLTSPGKYSVVFARFKGPKLSIRYTITSS